MKQKCSDSDQKRDKAEDRMTDTYETRQLQKEAECSKFENKQKEMEKKLKVLKHALKIGNCDQAGREFHISGSIIRVWRKQLKNHPEIKELNKIYEKRRPNFAKKYSQSFKKQILKQLKMKTKYTINKEYNIHMDTLSKWEKKYGKRYQSDDSESEGEDSQSEKDIKINNQNQIFKQQNKSYPLKYYPLQNKNSNSHHIQMQNHYDSDGLYSQDLEQDQNSQHQQ